MTTVAAYTRETLRRVLFWERSEMKALRLLGPTVLSLLLACSGAAAQQPADFPPCGTFWDGSVATNYTLDADPDGAATCCPSYSATSKSTFVSHSLTGEGVAGSRLDSSTATIDGSAALEGAIDVSGNVSAFAIDGFGSSDVSLGWFDTVKVISSALPKGTPVNFQETLSLNFTDTLSFDSFASQQVEVSWIPLQDEPDVPLFSMGFDEPGCDCTQSQNLAQDSLVNLAVGGKYQVIVTVQLTFAGIPFANREDGFAQASATAAFALASLSSDASFTTAKVGKGKSDSRKQSKQES